MYFNTLKGFRMRVPALTAFVVVTLFSTCATAQDYDVVILNGRVMDPETGFDAVANVISNGQSSTTAMSGSTEEEQFRTGTDG